ncbi:hemin import ATP-binding protein HmuV [Cytophagales bacterium WSM2-2]|nr:hemin import ATP-binding protein HmuV [Cytophagales bacterium WSM2-2]
MLQLQNISVSVGSKKLLNNISACFEPGKMNLIIGPNGSGKSTLIKAASKQIKTSSGSVLYGDKEISSLTYQDLAKFRAVLSQQVDVAFPLKVWEVVMLGRSPHFVTSPGPEDQQVVEEAMNYFDVWSMAERDYVTLSGGEKQRVNFARVLAQIWSSGSNQMRYLLLDEPLTFLDVNYQYQFMHKLQQLVKKNDLVVVGVVHDLNLAIRFGDTILLLNEGKIIANGVPEQVLTKENIKESFQILPEIHQYNNSFYLYF